MEDLEEKEFYYSTEEENYIKLEDKYFELCERKDLEDSLGDI